MPGHWEGDLLMGKRHTAIGTLVERWSRYVMLFPLPNGNNWAARDRTRKRGLGVLTPEHAGLREHGTPAGEALMTSFRHVVVGPAFGMVGMLSVTWMAAWGDWQPR